MEHAVDYMEEHNPDKKKESCISFLDSTDSELCAVAKKRFAEIKSSIKSKSKINNLD